MKHSPIKKHVANVHLGMLDSASLIIIAFIWFIVYTEGSLIAYYEQLAFGIENTIGMELRKSAIGFIGSLCAMLVPIFMTSFKSPNSSSGRKIDYQETIFVLLLIVVASVIPLLVWKNINKALDVLVAKKIKDDVFFDYQSYVVSITLLSNFMLDILLGYMTVVEINRNNKHEARLERRKNKRESDYKELEDEELEDDDDDIIDTLPDKTNEEEGEFDSPSSTEG